MLVGDRASASPEWNAPTAIYVALSDRIDISNVEWMSLMASDEELVDNQIRVMARLLKRFTRDERVRRVIDVLATQASDPALKASLRRYVGQP